MVLLFLSLQEVYDKLPIDQKIKYLVTSMRNSENGIEVCI